MKNEIAKIENRNLTPWETAQIYAKSGLLPVHFNKPEPVFVAFEMAERMGISPFMLMQNLYMVHGKPGIEAKLLIGLINSSGRFTPLEYRFSGKPGTDDFSCMAVARRASSRADERTIEGPKVSIGMAKAEGWMSKSGSKWKTMPELMLTYRAATFFARVNCPEIMLGMQTRDEIQDIGIQEPKRITESNPMIESHEETPPEPAGKFSKDDVITGDDAPADHPTGPVICGRKVCDKFDVTSATFCKKDILTCDHPDGITVREALAIAYKTRKPEIDKVVAYLEIVQSHANAGVDDPKNPDNWIEDDILEIWETLHSGSNVDGEDKF